MQSKKFTAGANFPDLSVLNTDGQAVSLINPSNENNWTMLVIYRGQHCPVCTKYLNRLQGMRHEFEELGIEIVAVSADTVAQLQQKLTNDVKVDFTVHAGLTLEQMQQLGLYVSQPMSSSETDHPFSEPALFVINSDNKVQVLEIANSPFVRPDLDMLLSGLRYTRENDYPVRGTQQP